MILAVLVAAAGCSGQDGSPATTGTEDTTIVHPGFIEAEGGTYLEVLVIDAEIRPLDGVTLQLQPNALSGLTDLSGAVTFGPLEPGSYTVIASKDGYGTIEKDAFVSADERLRLTITLPSVSRDVPYHETFVRVTFIQCGIGSSLPQPVGGSANVPCTVTNANYLTGINITRDSDVFLLRITSPNLANFVVESVWGVSVYAHDMLFAIVGKGQANSAVSVTGGVGTFEYRSRHAGPPPLVTWVTPGIKNSCGDVECTAVFDGNVSAEHDVVIRGVARNSTLQYVALYLDHRVENYLTFFYNRAGTTDFTALPDD